MQGKMHDAGTPVTQAEPTPKEKALSVGQLIKVIRKCGPEARRMVRQYGRAQWEELATFEAKDAQGRALMALLRQLCLLTDGQITLLRSRL